MTTQNPLGIRTYPSRGRARAAYLFLVGPGHLSRHAKVAARRFGAMLVNYFDPGCGCGHGCRHGCPANARHWFEAQNFGAPFDEQLARAVLAAVRAVATQRDLELLPAEEA